ncbi:hypothetical protein DERP_006585 [Dermatophagoides pteronyssinus]|uniref:Uncharacterized protein n=1 Tax=Dermatophagoides pteronyssinus TaxID=6956 RepID=A0ABQ8IQW7_DERPT|nr:hypothetical protein DERP_006585 [Dermatophagoides pteronyssinus]
MTNGKIIVFSKDQKSKEKLDQLISSSNDLVSEEPRRNNPIILLKGVPKEIDRSQIPTTTPTTAKIPSHGVAVKVVVYLITAVGLVNIFNIGNEGYDPNLGKMLSVIQKLHDDLEEVKAEIESERIMTMLSIKFNEAEQLIHSIFKPENAQFVTPLEMLYPEITLGEDIPKRYWHMEECQLENFDIPRKGKLIIKINGIKTDKNYTLLRADPFQIGSIETNNHTTGDFCISKYSGPEYMVYEERTECSTEIIFNPIDELQTPFIFHSKTCKKAIKQTPSHWKRVRCTEKALITPEEIVQTFKIENRWNTLSHLETVIEMEDKIVKSITMTYVRYYVILTTAISTSIALTAAIAYICYQRKKSVKYRRKRREMINSSLRRDKLQISELFIRKSARHGAKQDSSRMIIDEPSNGIDAIEMDEEPSTSEHLMEIDDEAYRISEESDGDNNENIEIPDFFLNPKNLKDYEEEVGGNKSENEALFMNSLMASELKTFYYDFLLDINSMRYQENINMQSIIKLVPMIIKHCLDVLPNDIKDYSSYHNYSTKLPAILIN